VDYFQSLVKQILKLKVLKNLGIFSFSIDTTTGALFSPRILSLFSVSGLRIEFEQISSQMVLFALFRLHIVFGTTRL